MRRREFITLLGGAAAAWPLAAGAQQPVERMRRVGVLMQLADGDPESRIQVAAFLQSLSELGWTIGRNLRLDTRWGEGDADRIRKTGGGTGGTRSRRCVGSWRHGRRGLATSQPYRADRVRKCHRSDRARLCLKPGPTGRERHRFHLVRICHGREMAGVAQGDRAARDPRGSPSGSRHYRRDRLLGSDPRTCAIVQGHGEPDRRARRWGDGACAHSLREMPNGGLIVTPDPAAIAHREPIITLAARHRLPACCPFRYFASEGGLMSYGPNAIDPFRRAAGYVDRILKGEKSTDLPVQAPTKYELSDQSQRPRKYSDSKFRRCCLLAPTR